MLYNNYTSVFRILCATGILWHSSGFKICIVDLYIVFVFQAHMNFNRESEYYKRMFNTALFEL